MIRIDEAEDIPSLLVPAEGAHIACRSCGRQ